MHSTLTQKDIDALLRGGQAATPAGARTDIAPFNFLVPSRVSRERQTALEAIYGRYALSLQAFLSSRLRAPMDVTVYSIEQATFGEFLMSLGSPCAAFAFRLAGGNHGVLDLGSGAAFHLVDRLFGGPGDTAPPPRALTALEQSVVRGIAERALALLREAWQDHLPLVPELAGFESNPEMLQIVHRDDPVLVTIFEVRTGSFAASVALCLPMVALERFLQEGTALRSTPAAASNARPLVEQQLRRAHATISVRLPVFRIRMGAITALTEGQTLFTGQAVDAPVDVMVNGTLRFQGSLGQRRRALALRVEKLITPPAPARPARQGRVL